MPTVLDWNGEVSLLNRSGHDCVVFGGVYLRLLWKRWLHERFCFTYTAIDFGLVFFVWPLTKMLFDAFEETADKYDTRAVQYANLCIQRRVWWKCVMFALGSFFDVILRLLLNAKKSIPDVGRHSMSHAQGRICLIWIKIKYIRYTCISMGEIIG